MSGSPASSALLSSGDCVRPSSWDEALDLRSQHPEARPICGGTDLMVEVNFDRTRPPMLLDLSAVDDLRRWELVDDDRIVRLGAGVPYAVIVRELATLCPALAIAARTVGSPQIRNRGTVGGNLATASPAGDSHPPLLAVRAQIEVASIRGSRLIPVDEFFLGPKRSALVEDELIRAIRLPAARGPQQFAKIGPRNAMVIATVSFALGLDRLDRRVGTGIGSAGPTPRRALEAEQLLEADLDWHRAHAPPASIREFGRLVADAASPIDDVRGTADYRRHALSVLAQRTASWAIAELGESPR